MPAGSELFFYAFLRCLTFATSDTTNREFCTFGAFPNFATAFVWTLLHSSAFNLCPKFLLWLWILVCLLYLIVCNKLSILHMLQLLGWDFEFLFLPRLPIHCSRFKTLIWVRFSLPTLFADRQILLPAAVVVNCGNIGQQVFHISLRNVLWQRTADILLDFHPNTVY